MILRLTMGAALIGSVPFVARSLLVCGMSLGIWLSILPGQGFAQQASDFSAADTSSPRDTLRSFIDGCNLVYETIKADKYLDPRRPEQLAATFRILDCLDMRELPAFSREEQAAEIAVCIKEILDRTELPPWDEIPDVEEIEAAGGYEKLSRWRIPDTRITIVRMDAGAQKHEYLFSAGTLSRAVDYFMSVRSRPYRADGPAVSEGFYRWYMSAPRSAMLAEIVDRLPASIRQGRIFGMARWKWPFLILAIAIALGIMAISYWLYLKMMAHVGPSNLFKYWASLSLPVFAAWIPLCFFNVIQFELGVRGDALYVVGFLAMATALVCAIVVVFAATTRIAETIIASPRVNPLGLNAYLIRIASKMFGAATVVALVLTGGQYLGVPVATLLTSAGIGGVALALGAQDTLKDLFGTLSLMADQPFRVGERIIFGKYDGMVEDIGLRSTKLRLLTGHLVTLPNEQMARSQVENVGRRQHIRRIADIQLPLDTSRESMEKAIEAVRIALSEHDGMDPEFPPRVFFTDFLPTAFNIRVMYWYHPPDYWGYVETSEQINFAIFKAFEAEGIRFSLPTRVVPTSISSEAKPLEVMMVGET